MLVFFTNLTLMEFEVRYLALFFLFSVIDSFRWFWIGSLHKNIQLMLEFLKAPFLVLQFSSRILMTFLMIFSVTLLSIVLLIYSVDTTFYSKCDQASDLWQQLELAYELEPDLWDTSDWGRKCLQENLSLIHSIKFLSPELAMYLYKSTIWHAWNTVVKFGLVLLVATWNC